MEIENITNKNITVNGQKLNPEDVLIVENRFKRTNEFKNLLREGYIKVNEEKETKKEKTQVKLNENSK